MATISRPGGAQRFPALDLIRLAAAMAVAFYHLAYLLSPRPDATFAFGWVGVEVFFVISGFVIAFSAAKQSPRRFVVNRALRLYPVAIVASVAIALIRIADGSPLAGQFMPLLRSALLFPIGPWLDNVFWTLPIEIMFYAAVAIGVACRWPLERIALALGLYSSVYWLVVILGTVAGARLPDLSNGKYTLTLLHYGVFFALGMLIYARRHGHVALVFLGIALVAVFARSSRLEHGASLFAAPFAWLVAMLLVETAVRANARLQFLRTRTLGRMTYPLYLMHSTVGIAVFGLMNAPAALATALILSVLLSYAILPLETALVRLLTQRRRPAIAMNLARDGAPDAGAAA